ncbi:PsbP-related protein [Algoriphagus halophytocola]|uniref:PsbP-related protein n=1 Tax=Algoriphagus halophytocola TaxID=2991499 RepID=A0ABY6MGV7_9BACT|nr:MULTISPECIES: PsbP-related protein [unclassified Algoriphagus]UZD21429.1 PsbP-related protein [Algoriphagus sp. TR-M5]WBL42641.1 PsbP-related protein [Algoriphagus sp. TR-M9]
MDILVQVISVPNYKIIMIHRLLVILSIALLPLVATAQNRVEVTDPEIKFSYSLPEGWQVKDDGYDYIIQSPDNQDTYISLTYVESAKGADYLESLGGKQSFEEDFLFEIRYILTEDFSNLGVLENGSTTIDETKASWVKFSHGENGEHLGVFYMYQKLNQTFKITGTAPADQFEKVKPNFTAIINSFQAEKR